MTVIRYPYLGKPAAMTVLPSPNGDIDASSSRGDVPVSLIGGGQAVIRRLHPRKTFVLPFESLTPVDADLITGFYSGLYGSGPFVFVDASVRNVLGLDVSTCGVRTQASNGWVASSGTVTADTSQTSPVAGSGVVKLAGAGTSASLQPGVTANTATIAKAPVYLPGEAVTVSLYAKASASAACSLQLAGYGTSGAVTVTSLAASASVTTSWQRFTVTAAIGAGAFASAAFVLPRLMLPVTAPANLWIAAAQVEYGDTVTAWQPGYGSPRVVITAPPGRTVPLYGYSTHTLTLGEVG